MQQQIGRYQVVEEIARGGMGVVFLARDGNAMVALKLMHAVGNEVARKRFQREAEALARVNHPGVVKLLDHGIAASGEPYMAMGIVSGESLQALLDAEGPFAPERAVALMLQLCEAVAACHAAGVLHRDLKPENVLLVGDRVMVTDFGITRDLDPNASRTHLTVQGKFLGSPGYWAPEQAGGRLGQIGEVTDVYGIGATLFALLTGQPPHQGETLPDLLQAVVEQKPAPSSLNPAVPNWLDEIVGRALETEPGDRIRTVDALATALARGEGVPRGLPLLSAFTLVVLGLCGAAVILLLGSSPDPAPVAKSPARIESPTVVGDALAEPSVVGHTLADRRAQALVAFERGTARFKVGDAQGAIAEYGEAIRIDPEFADAHSNRGSVRASLGDHEGAIADWDEAIRLGSERAEVYLNRGGARVERGDYQGAIVDSDVAIRLRPDLARGYDCRGFARMSLGDYQGAIVDYDEAIRVQPDYADAHFHRGVARVNLGEWQGGVMDYDEAIRLKPDNAEAYALRGFARGILSDYRGAIVDYDEAIRLRSDNADAYCERARLRATLGDEPGAIADCSEAIRLQPGIPKAYVYRAKARGNLGDLRGAIEDFERAIDLEPNASWAAQVRQDVVRAHQEIAKRSGH